VAKLKPVAAAPVVTLKAVFEQLGETHDLPKKQVHGLLAGFVITVTKHLQAGARIRMSGLGTLEVKREARARAATRRPVRPSRLRQARRWRFAPPKNLRKPYGRWGWSSTPPFARPLRIEAVAGVGRVQALEDAQPPCFCLRDRGR
jgi:nucleoid DNA-binding protein